MSKFYLQLSHYLPGTYAVEGIMNLVLGGPGIEDDVLALVSILFISIGIVAALVTVQKEKCKSQITAEQTV